MSTNPPNDQMPTAGWYQDAQGRTRWWDGTSWGQLAAEVTPAGEVMPAVGGQPVGQPTTLDAGAALSYAWAKFSAHAGPFVALTLAMFAVSIIAMIIVFAALVPAVAAGSGSNAGLTAVAWLLFGAAWLLTLVLNLVVTAGAMRAALAVTRGDTPSLSMLVSTENLGTFVGTVVLVSIATTIGFFLCILPGIAVACFAAYAPFIALDEGASPIDAISRSVALVRANLGPVLLVLILAYAVYYAGSLVCYVGLLVSVPVALIMIAYSYRVLRGQPLAL